MLVFYKIPTSGYYRLAEVARAAATAAVRALRRAPPAGVAAFAAAGLLRCCGEWAERLLWYGEWEGLAELIDAAARAAAAEGESGRRINASTRQP